MKRSLRSYLSGIACDLRMLRRRLWALVAGTTRTSRSVTFYSGLNVERVEYDWCSHEFQRADGTWEKVIWDRKEGTELRYTSIDGGKTWALIV